MALLNKGERSNERRIDRSMDGADFLSLREKEKKGNFVNSGWKKEKGSLRSFLLSRSGKFLESSKARQGGLGLFSFRSWSASQP